MSTKHSEKKKRKVGVQVILKTFLNIFINGTQHNSVTMDKMGNFFPFSAGGQLVLTDEQNYNNRSSL